MNDIELTVAALQACGYRCHIKERNGTQWVTAVKGLDVQYKHWHPLTNINQAMQLLVEAPHLILLDVDRNDVFATDDTMQIVQAGVATGHTAQGIINAQCRAIINACAALKPV